MLLSGGLLAVGLCGWLSPLVVAPVAVVAMASIVLLVPWLVGPLSAAAAWLLRPLAKLEARLAQWQMRRRPVRTALTMGVLYLAASLGTGEGTTIINNVNDVRSWYRQTMLADFVVRAAAPDTATGQSVELPSSLGDEIKKVPGVTHVGGVRFFTARAANHAVYVVARDFSGKTLGLDLYGGDSDDVRRRLAEGDVVIGTVLAHFAGLHVGDEITMETRQGTRQLRIGGLAVDYLAGGYIVYMRLPLAEQEFGVHGVDALLVQAGPDALNAVHAALRKLPDSTACCSSRSPS